MAAPQYSGNWQRIREALYRSGIWIGQPCPRCGLPLWPGQRLHLGHATDVAAGGMGGPVRFEHGACNERAGQLVAAANRKAKRARERTPAEREAHNHLIAVRQRRAWRKAEQEFEQAEHGRQWLSGTSVHVSVRAGPASRRRSAWDSVIRPA